MPLLECMSLVKDYPGKRAVDGVDFSVEAGEIVGLLGPNGAGKTTSFRMTCGLIAPTQGRVLFNGTDVTKWPMYRRARHGMGYLPQDESVFAKLTVEKNIIAILEFLNMSRKERKRRCEELLSRFGLQEKSKQIASTLSGGERRRLEIARCLASDPKLILLDEPFTGIDPVTIHSIQDIIGELCDNGISILLTDHRERETLTITDRSYIIVAGKVLCCGTAEEVLNHPEAKRLYFGKRFDAVSIIESKGQFSGDELPEDDIADHDELPRFPTVAEFEAACEDGEHLASLSEQSRPEPQPVTPEQAGPDEAPITDDAPEAAEVVDSAPDATGASNDADDQNHNTPVIRPTSTSPHISPDRDLRRHRAA